MATQTVRLSGYRQFQRAVARAGKDAKEDVKEAFREVAEPVRADAVMRMESIDARSAAGYRVVVRQRGVAVEQRLKRTTGRRPDYGRLQMRRALEPALEANEGRIERGVEKAIDKIADRFERGA